MNAIFMLKLINWILRSILCLAVIFLTLGKVLFVGLFCRTKPDTAYVEENIFSSKPSHVAYHFNGNFMLNKFY